MFNKMIAQQTAKKEKLLDNFLKKRNIRFRKMWNSFVTLTIWEMESPVISWIFTVPEIMKENFQSCLTCTEAVFSLEKKKRDFSSLLYLRETLEKEFVLSIYK